MRALMKESFTLYKKYFKVILVIFFVGASISGLAKFIAFLFDNTGSALIGYLSILLIGIFILIPLSCGLNKTIYNICTDKIDKKLDVLYWYKSPHKVTYVLIAILKTLAPTAIVAIFGIAMGFITITGFGPLIAIASLLTIPLVLFIVFVETILTFSYFLYFDLPITRPSNYVKYAFKLSKNYYDLIVKYMIASIGFNLVVALAMLSGGFFLMIALGLVVSIPLLIPFAMFFVIAYLVFFSMLVYYLNILVCKMYKYIIDNSIYNGHATFITEQITNKKIQELSKTNLNEISQ